MQLRAMVCGGAIALLMCQISVAAALPEGDSTFGATPFELDDIAVKSPVSLGAHAFPLSAIRITGGPLLRSQRADEAYLLRLEPDRLLHYVRKNVGLAPKADHYGGWDSGGSGIIGHYLSALCNMYAATGNDELLKRVNYIIAELDECQRARSDGGLFGMKSDIGWFDRMKKADPIYPPIVNGWYVTHKQMAGLRDAYALTHSDESKAVFLKMCDWAVDVCANLSDEQFQRILDSEHGAPQDPLADAYAITGDEKYLKLARRFVHHRVFDPLLADKVDVLDGLHANTQIPKFVGYERAYELTGDVAFNRASTNFWNDVVHRRSWVTGGNSQWEKFFATENWSNEITQVCGPESCNSYNMLKLTRQMFELSPDVKQVDYFERVLFNSILPSQDDAGGGFVYYTAMRPGHYRTFSTEFDGGGFWCCTGTGLESHARLGDLIYAHADDALLINLLVPSRLAWPERGLTLTQETDFPTSGTTKLTLTLSKPTTLAIKLRIPTWTSGKATLKVNGQPQSIDAKPGTYLSLSREWADGDTVEFDLPMAVTTETLAGSDQYVAFLRGPIVLAAPLGTSPLTEDDIHPTQRSGTNLARRQLPGDDVPVIVASDGNLSSRLTQVDALKYLTGDLTQPKPATLIPFYDVGPQRYAIYFRRTDAAGYAKIIDDARRAEAEAADLERRTIDRVVVGSQQSEADHRLESKDSHTGNAPPPLTSWRDADGFFSYELDLTKAPANTPLAIRCMYWGSDSGRDFTISADGERIGTERLTGAAPSRYVEKLYPIPAKLIAKKSSIRVRFEPAPGSTAGGVFDVRLVTVPSR